MSRHPVVPVVVLASVSIAGLVGMLVVDGALDSAFLLLAAVPLLVGGWRAFALRRAGRRPGHDDRDTGSR